MRDFLAGVGAVLCTRAFLGDRRTFQSQRDSAFQGGLLHARHGWLLRAATAYPPSAMSDSDSGFSDEPSGLQVNGGGKEDVVDGDGAAGDVVEVSTAAVMRQNAELLRQVEQLSRENQTLRRQLRVVESKVSGGFAGLGTRIGGLEKSLVAITSAATAGLLNGGGRPPARAPPRRLSITPGQTPPSRSAPAPPGRARRSMTPRIPGGAGGAGAGAGGGAAAAADLRGGDDSQASGLETRLRGVVARKSSASSVQAKRRSSVTAFALGKISEGDLLDDAASADASAANDSALGFSGPKAKIWCGTWNVGAKEPFSGSQVRARC